MSAPFDRAAVFKLADELEASCLRVAAASTPAEEAHAHTIRHELYQAAEALGRAGGADPVARILRIIAGTAVEDEGLRAERAARRAHRSGNPVAGLLANSRK